MPGDPLALLLDRAEISDVVHRYALAIDRLDADLFRSCFTEHVDIDFSSMGAGRHEAIAVDAWLEQVYAGMGGFDATHHVSSNHVHDLRGDQATCVSYLTAEHFLFEDAGERSLTLGGHYTNELVRMPAGWRICATTLSVTWHRGSLALFAESRERYLARQGRRAASARRPWPGAR
jgi:hypothetical protein